MGYYGSPQHQRHQDARAIIRMARKLVADVDALLIEARLRRTPPRRIVFKTRDNALVMPRLRYRVTNNVRCR